jgi:hypothetical protein
VIVITEFDCNLILIFSIVLVFKSYLKMHVGQKKAYFDVVYLLHDKHFAQCWINNKKHCNYFLSFVARAQFDIFYMFKSVWSKFHFTYGLCRKRMPKLATFLFHFILKIIYTYDYLKCLKSSIIYT